jgi:hypothetical protein
MSDEEGGWQQPGPARPVAPDVGGTSPAAAIAELDARGLLSAREKADTASPRIQGAFVVMAGLAAAVAIAAVADVGYSHWVVNDVQQPLSNGASNWTPSVPYKS